MQIVVNQLAKQQSPAAIGSELHAKSAGYLPGQHLSGLAKYHYWGSFFLSGLKADHFFTQELSFQRFENQVALLSSVV